jgi:hypothetical protein
MEVSPPQTWDGPPRGGLADKLQVFMLTKPLAAREEERLIDRLLAKIPASQ